MRLRTKLAIGSSKFSCLMARYKLLAKKNGKKEAIYRALIPVACLVGDLIDQAEREYERNNIDTARERIREVQQVLQYLTKEMYSVGRYGRGDAQYIRLLSAVEMTDSAIKAWMDKVCTLDMLLKRLRAMG